MTGIVLWDTNGATENADIQLEFFYITYSEVVKEDGSYDWSSLEERLDKIAARKHQAVLRWHDTYVAKPTGVPKYITSMQGYQTLKAKSEGKLTEFPDWSFPELQRFVLRFYTEFTKRYDNDPRIAFVEVGFGLWAEYHIYDGPMELGKTFPSKAFQKEFALHLSKSFKTTPWMISIDAAEDQSPFADDDDLQQLRFGLFDDSFNHRKHAETNEKDWNRMGRERWKNSPMGGEFSFYEKVDQSKALSPEGPHGISFETKAAEFHLTFILGDSQSRFQRDTDRVRVAGMACGYRFRVIKFESSPGKSEVVITNSGIAPIYYDAFPAVDGIRSSASLKGLLPGERRLFTIGTGGDSPKLSIECDRLVNGQQISYDADLKAEAIPVPL